MLYGKDSQYQKALDKLASSYYDAALAGRPKDAGQVAAIGRRYAELDLVGALAPLFEGDPALPEHVKRQIELEAAWILGVQTDNAL